MEEAPSLAGLGVVAFIELVDQFVASLALCQLADTAMQHRWAAVGLLVDLVDDAVENRHCAYLE